MKKFKNAKGITLVALVVTIIVLLILAGVSLSLVAGGNGIIDRASNASNRNKQEAIREIVELRVAQDVAQYYEEKYVNNQVGTTTTALDYLATRGGTAHTIVHESYKNIYYAFYDKDATLATVDDATTVTYVPDPTVTKLSDKEPGTILVEYKDGNKVGRLFGTISTNGAIGWLPLSDGGFSTVATGVLPAADTQVKELNEI